MLLSSVGNNLTNREDDVRQVKNRLSRAGIFDNRTAPEPHGFITREMDEGIKEFQKSHDLKIDGKLFPGGETENALFGFVARREEDRPSVFDATGRLIRTPDYVPQVPQEDKLDDRFILTAAPVPKKKPEPENKPVEYDATGRMIRPKADADTDTVPIPERKPEVPNISDVKLPQYESDPVFDKFRENLKPREGGIANRSKAADLGGLTNKGMSQAFLDDLNARSPELNLPKKSTDLTDEQIEWIFKKEFFERTQVDKLQEIAGEDKTGSKLVEHVFDAGVMTNPKEVGRWLQKSIDETIGTDLKVNQNGKQLYDGILGSQTRIALKKAVEEGKTLEISRKFWRKRLDYLKERKNASENPGWWPRLEEFRE